MTPPPLNGSALETPHEEDKRLVLAFKAGDDDSYRLIYERHEALVRRITRRMLRNPQDAEEAFQETFLKIYTALGRFNGRYQLGAWIARVTTNVCLDHLRSRSRHPVDAVEPEVLEADADFDLETSDPEYQVMRIHESRRVRRVLDQLPPLHRAAIVLRDFEGLSYGEVAAALKISECQTKALIHRARKGFRRSWTGSLAALLPWRWMQKVRRLDGAEQSAQGWMPSTHAVAQCSTFAQQCVQAFGDRLAPLATAAMMTGVAAAGPGVTGHNDPRPAADSVVPVVALRAADVEGTRIERDSSPQQRASMTPEPRAEETPPSGDETAPPATEAPPAEEPTTEPEEGTATPPPPAPTPSPTSTPSAPAWGPEPTSVSLALDVARSSDGAVCSCLRPTSVESESAQKLDDGSWRVTQNAAGTASASGADTYGLRISHTVDHDNDSFRVVLETNKGGYIYSGTGTVSGSSANSWGGRSVTFTGTFSLNGWPERNDALPSSGTYVASVELSRSGQRILATSILFQ